MYWMVGNGLFDGIDHGDGGAVYHGQTGHGDTGLSTYRIQIHLYMRLCVYDQQSQTPTTHSLSFNSKMTVDAPA